MLRFLGTTSAYIGSPKHYLDMEKAAKGKFDLVVFDSRESASRILSQCPDILMQVIVEELSNGELQIAKTKDGVIGFNPFASN